MTNLFQDNNDSQPETPDLSQVENPLELLVGEGRKYKDAKVLVQSVFEKENFIEQLKRENAELRASTNKVNSIEEMVNKLLTQGSAPKQPTGSNQPDPVVQNAGQGNQATALTIDDVKRLMSEEMTQAQLIAQKRDNVAKVENTLKQTWGDSYKTVLKSKPAELGVTQDFLAKLAEEAPEVFVKLVVGQNSSPPPSAPRGSVNPAAYSTPKGDVKNYAYYKNIRKTNPTLYNSGSVQMEMHKQAAAMGADFYK